MAAMVPAATSSSVGTLKTLELYSGIGGMRCSLQRAAPHLHHQMMAVDVNTVANAVYAHNFGDQPYTLSLERATAHQLSGFQLWTLSPPCQPYTTTANSLQRDDADPRAASFLHLLALLPQLPQPPKHLLLENVPGFKASRCAERWRAVLDNAGYRLEEVLLCPHELLAIPYQRPRYFALASKRRPAHSSPTLQQRLSAAAAAARAAAPEATLRSYLEFGWPLAGAAARFVLEPAVVARYGRIFDIVTPESTVCNCFTKAYGSGHVRAAGSILASVQGAQELCERDSRGRLHLPRHNPYVQLAQDAAAGRPVPQHLLLRTFTPREVASLHGFPAAFGFPEGVTDRQRFALLGNSLSVDVVTVLLQHLLSGDM